MNSTISNTKKGPTELRKKLDFDIQKFKNGDDFQWLTESQFPPEVNLLIGTICAEFRHRKPTETSKELPESEGFKEALDVYRHYFKPGTCTYHFLPEDFDNADPSPHYHSVTGESFIYLDWKLVAPKQKLFCYNCKCCGADSELKSTKTNFSHNKTLFPIWSGSGRPIPAVLMQYKCQHCSTVYKANDGRLLTLLPPHIRSVYPVDPNYATGFFHLTNDISDDLEDNMRTYANADVVSKRLYKKIGKSYTKSCGTYLSQQPTVDYLTESQYINGQFPPSGKSLRDLYEISANSPLHPYQYSRYDRQKRELQSVQVGRGDLAAIDWTFATIKNYYNLPGAKCLFTMNKGEFFFYFEYQISLKPIQSTYLLFFLSSSSKDLPKRL